jgi:tetratricopeptide (TPR) repeat protein
VLGPTKARALLAAASLAAGSLPCAPRAWADSTAVSAAGSTSENAAALAEQGVTLFHEHQYEASREAFSRAYELDPRTETLLELALAELHADRPVEASHHFREYIGRSDAPQAKVDIVRTKWLPRAEASTARPEAFAHEVTPVADAPAEPAMTPPASAPADRDARGPGHSRAKWIAAAGLESAAVVATGIAIGFSIAVERSASNVHALAARVREDTGGDSGCQPPTPDARCGQVQSDRQSELTNAAMANRFYVAGGALAAIGAASFFLWPEPKEASAAALRPGALVGDHTAGAILVGAW